MTWRDRPEVQKQSREAASKNQRHCEGVLIHLEVSHHHQAQGVGAARYQGAGVDPTLVAVLNHLGVA